jgi:hypothetical protein
MKTIKLLLFIAVILISLPVFNSDIQAQYYIRNTTVIDTPTAYTIGRGTYQVSFFSYDDGGVELKTIIGLHDNIYLGVSVDSQNAIGKDKAEPNVPGVIAKLKFTDGWEQFPISLAAGYDSFYLGKVGKTYNNNNELNRMIYGPYLAVTKPIYLFDDEQHIHFGVRVPTQPEYVPDDSSYFLSLDIPMGEYFMFKGEGERVYFDFSRRDDWLLNFGIRYSYYAQLGIEFDVILQSGERANRIIRIEYKDEF